MKTTSITTFLFQLEDENDDEKNIDIDDI